LKIKLVTYFAFFGALIFTVTLSASPGDKENWVQWRGPDFNGVAAPGSYPVKFSATDDLLWKVSLPGKGCSTPVVWKDRIFITSAFGGGNGEEDGVLCFDWDGKLLWQVKLGKQVPGKHPRGSGSNPSPVTDGKRLFVYFKSGTVAALDFKGEVIWKTNLLERFGKINMFWDIGTSPVLAEGNVIIAVMHAGESYLVAFDQKTGEVAWKVDRNYVCPTENDQSYTTPLVIENADSDVLVVSGADHVTGHLAATGEMIWETGGFNPDNQRSWRMIASPVIYNDILMVPYGRGRFLSGVKIGGKGNITEKALLWQKERIGTDVSTPVVKDGIVYIVSFNGNVWCLDIKTGKVHWEAKLPNDKAAIYSSPTLAENKLYVIRENGTFYVCEIKPDGMEVLNQVIFDDQFAASPVLVQNRILLRGDKNLYCIGK
jgi:outer membrane protein assembly factor BamB